MVMMKDLKVEEYSQPTEFVDDRGRKGARIVQLITRTQPHRENLKDDYNKVAVRALEEKKSLVLEKWFSHNLHSYYVAINDEYKNCKEVQKWVSTETAVK